MPEELQSYAVTLVNAILSAKELTSTTFPEQRAKGNKHQAEQLSELVTFLLEHLHASGYDTDAIALAVRHAVIGFIMHH